ncbi:MAG: efflux RND transporter periplasmic adaptor subunit [Gemmatimonadales bacterium]|nr:MAG: efflux RND transporter periplasmic adaptor subunit [Gemmatimonadales bacterium]
MRRLLLLLLLPALAACGGDEPGEIPRTPVAGELQVTQAFRSTGGASFAATLDSDQVAEIATRASGTVRSVEVRVGDRVRSGAPLLRLDDDDVEARVESARAQLELATETHRRIRSLADDGAATRQELDEAQAALAGARGALREAEAQREYSVIHAPFSGVVTHRWVDPGDLAGPGRALLRIVAPEALKVIAELPAHLAGAVAEGDEVLVHLGSGHPAIPATVQRIVPAVDPASRTFRLEALPVEVPEAARVGSYVRLELPFAEPAGVWIPRDAVLERGQLTGVFAVEEDRIRLRWVRLGRTTGDAVELLAGPAGDLTVVRRPGAELMDGQTISQVREVSP